ncbi:MAG: penicillin-binding transpeptidase domain-containing protein [Vicinamibacterales bacterium]
MRQRNPSPAGLQRIGRPDSRRPSSRSIPKLATCWRWWAGETTHAAPSNRATRAKRQPGSTFKTFVFTVAALERGYSPVLVLEHLDAVVVTPAAGDPEWSPRNAENEASTSLTLRAALAESNNAAAVVLQQQLDRPRGGSRPQRD